MILEPESMVFAKFLPAAPEKLTYKNTQKKLWPHFHLKWPHLDFTKGAAAPPLPKKCTEACSLDFSHESPSPNEALKKDLERSVEVQFPLDL